MPIIHVGVYQNNGLLNIRKEWWKEEKKERRKENFILHE